MIGAILLDYSSQSAMNPCEALLSDLFEDDPSGSPDTGFAVYSGLLSFGGCLGYLVTAVKWPKPLSGPFLGGQEGASFFLAIMMIFLAVFMTGIAAKEEPQNLAVNDREQKRGGGSVSLKLNQKLFYRRVLRDVRSIVTQIGKALRIIVEKAILFPSDLYKEIKSSPLVLQRLFITDVVSWSAIMCYYLFYTNYVGQEIYGGNPMAAVGTEKEALYNEGVRMGSWGLLLHSVTACVYASLIQDQIIRSCGLKLAHFGGLMAFSISMVGVFCSNEIIFLNAFAAFSGIGFATVTTIPNSLVAIYRSNQETFFFDVHEERGSGADFAILNVAYYLGQILLSLVMSNIGQILGRPLCYIIFAATAGFTSCYFASRTVYSLDQLRTYKDMTLVSVTS